MSLNLDRSTWKRVKLGDVVLRSRTQVDPFEGNVDRYVAGGHIDTDSVIISRSGDVADGQMGSTFRYVFKPGQVLFVSARPYLRKSGIPDFAGVVADKTYVLEAVPANGLLQDMLPFLLTSDRFVEYATQEATGSMNPRLLWGAMQRYEFDLPPIDEQRRIADLFCAVERHCSSEEHTAAFLEEAIGRFCIDVYERMSHLYPRSSFKQVGELTMGRQKAPKYMTGVESTPYLRVANIGSLELNLAEVEEMDFSERDLARFRLQPGDVLLTEGDIVSPLNVGRPAVFSGELADCAFQNTLIRFRPQPGADSMFFAALFEGMRRAGVFAGAASTTTVTHLGLGRLSTVPLPDVPGPTQAQIGDGLRSLVKGRFEINSTRRALASVRFVLLAEIFGRN